MSSAVWHWVRWSDVWNWLESGWGPVFHILGTRQSNLIGPPARRATGKFAYGDFEHRHVSHIPTDTARAAVAGHTRVSLGVSLARVLRLTHRGGCMDVLSLLKQDHDEIKDL